MECHFQAKLETRNQPYSGSTPSIGLKSLLEEEKESPVSSSSTRPGNGIELAPGAQNPDVSAAPSATGILNSYLFVFVIAFGVTILVTPLIRRLAIKAQIVDWPDLARKTHREPVAYLGGVALFIGLMAGIGASYFVPGEVAGIEHIPPNILIGMAIIMFTGLADDIFHFDVRLKLAGQFFAGAALAFDEQIGGRVAAGLLQPIQDTLINLFHIPWLDFTHFDLIPGPMHMEINLVYGVGTVIIALFVVGGCNSANLIDGLDGLLTGATAIMASALLVISAMLPSLPDPAAAGQLTAVRVVLCFALLGACLGFLPHNFRPATIFLGDAGSLLCGFCVMVIVLLLGETGRTHLVFAGLIVFSLPILDTTLAIIRRRLNKLPISAPDDNHLHHMLKRTKLGTIGAVFMMYAVTGIFGITAIILVTLRARVVYAVVLVLAGFIVVTGIKEARRKQQKLEIESLQRQQSVRSGYGAAWPPSPLRSQPSKTTTQSRRTAVHAGSAATQSSQPPATPAPPAPSSASAAGLPPTSPIG